VGGFKVPHGQRFSTALPHSQTVIIAKLTKGFLYLGILNSKAGLWCRRRSKSGPPGAPPPAAQLCRAFQLTRHFAARPATVEDCRLRIFRDIMYRMSRSICESARKCCRYVFTLSYEHGSFSHIASVLAPQRCRPLLAPARSGSQRRPRHLQRDR